MNVRLKSIFKVAIGFVIAYTFIHCYDNFDVIVTSFKHGFSEGFRGM